MGTYGSYGFNVGLPWRTESIYLLVFCEVQWNLEDIKVYSGLCAPSSIALRNYILSEELLCKLQWSFKELPLDGHIKSWLSKGTWWCSYSVMHFFDPLEPRINRLVIREWLIALFLNPDPQAMNPDLNVNKQTKQYTPRATFSYNILQTLTISSKDRSS